MTAKGVAAISCIQLDGSRTQTIIEKIFKPTDGKKAKFNTGDILLGNIYNGAEIVDHVVIGCEGPDNFMINCHGNPIIVEMIMKLLKSGGAELVSAEQMLTDRFSRAGDTNKIAVEAKIAQFKAVTLDGVRIIANQPEHGLGKAAADWLEQLKSGSLEQITADCKQILHHSRIARLIINGCRVVLAGPPNSGKSTLLNCLTGREKAIVTDIAGTTRDWVSGLCRDGSLVIEFVDTAGLDESIAAGSDVDRASQKTAKDILANSDLVLLVLDGSRKKVAWAGEVVKDKKILVVFNKSDIGSELGERDLNFEFAAAVRISALRGEGVERLLGKIRQVLEVTDFDLRRAVCFTDRQQKLLSQLCDAKTASQAKSVITELLGV